ncbi:MAG: GMC family oxidoreductase [Chloroflexi bacterium]|nr:GMC family oxidoreductase [Chloroflexota bacterium]
MPRLSSSIGDLKDHYSVVVIGSGYGGGIAASRLARAGQQVCLLERGKEMQPGEYPNSLRTALPEVQVTLAGRHIGSPTGLYDIRVNNDINVFLGCGLGGTSLVNANVSIRAETRVFEDPRWPGELRNDLSGSLEDGYQRAEEMLKPTPYPDDFPQLAKLNAHQLSADRMQEKFYRPPINVNFADRVNHVGVQQAACTLCGDCMSGCNYGAKNTVLMNYLPDAKNHGAEIFTKVSVRRLERSGDRWVVHYQLMECGREVFDAPTLFVTADLVILAAGTLGSTEILLRSQEAGLPLSGELGNRFSGNGDVLGFGYNNDRHIDPVGFGHRKPGKRTPVGPCITSVIDLRERPELDDGMIIEEGSVTGALARFIPPFLAVAGRLVGKDTDRGLRDKLKEKLRVWRSLLFGAYHGAVRNTQVYLIMSYDDGAGRMSLEKDELRIDWPGVGSQPNFESGNDRLKEATKALGGTYVKNPTWSKLTNHNVVTVHPLGGCVMGEDASSGVVNHKGQVFSGSNGTDVHQGLYVADGAVVPRPLGVNPLLTISALAERTCRILAEERGWEIKYELPSAPASSPKPEKVGIQFTETMRGYFSTLVEGDYQEAADLGKESGSSLDFTLTIISDDLETMLQDANHQAKMVGTVVAPSLSDQPLMATQGEFNLLVADPDLTNARKMLYRMRMTTREGRVYFFEGFKSIHDDPGFDMWSDTTTLYVTIYDGDSAASPMAGKGVLKIETADFARQMTTMQANNARNIKEGLRAKAKFGRFFAGQLWKTYGLG